MQCKIYNKHMDFLIFAFFISLLVTLGLVRYQHLHEKISSDHDLSGPQKFHTLAVPRIGGIGIFLGILFAGLLTFWGFKLDRGYLVLQLATCALPAFLVGLLEDVTKKIGVKTRLIATAVSAGLVGYFLNAWVSSIQVPGIDWLLGIGAISIIFSADSFLDNESRLEIKSIKSPLSPVERSMHKPSAVICNDGFLSILKGELIS